MTKSHRCLTLLATASLSLILAACGGGSDGGPPVLTRLPAMATDGFNWFNTQRQLMGLAAVTRSPAIDIAAQGHSDYQAANNVITHDQDPSKQGFTGREGCPLNYPVKESRMQMAGYVFTIPYACGEVISATSDTSGSAAAEALITAIYHRFVIFDPIFLDAGVGATSVASGRTYFTTDFGTTNSSVSGLASGKVVVYPYANQQQVLTSFDHGTEQPNPLPDNKDKYTGVNKDVSVIVNVIVGYPISIQANANECIITTSFTVAPASGIPLLTYRLTYDNDPGGTVSDPHPTPLSAAAIIPSSPLTAHTTYDVAFTGNLHAPNTGCDGTGTPFERKWSFTTR